MSKAQLIRKALMQLLRRSVGEADDAGARAARAGFEPGPAYHGASALMTPTPSPYGFGSYLPMNDGAASAHAMRADPARAARMRAFGFDPDQKPSFHGTTDAWPQQNRYGFGDYSTDDPLTQDLYKIDAAKWPPRFTR